ncbi:MAG: DUF1175 family protein [Acidobacteria bacterium]|nr:DUF1175 family protein [Acidobacteriota bacterium]
MRAAAVFVLLLLVPGAASVRAGLDSQDRAAFLAWFVLLADAQFYRPTTDVADCAGLVRHAAREALREHSPEWQRRMAIPGGHVGPPLRDGLEAAGDRLPIFRVSDGPQARRAEFADARTILRWNAGLVSRDPGAARPGDVLAFQHAGQRLPEHLMVFVGRSVYEPDGRDWVVYHTGPDLTAGAAGEMRKVRLTDLQRHPSARWRPLPANPAFLGVYRLRIP